MRFVRNLITGVILISLSCQIAFAQSNVDNEYEGRNR